MANDYDVFLSHNSADKAAVEAIARRLRDEADLQPFLDKWDLVPGEKWQPALESAMKASATVAVFFGANGKSVWHEQETLLALADAAQKKEKRVIPVLLPGAHKTDVDGFLSLRTWVDLGEKSGFKSLVAGIKGVAPGGGGQKKAAERLPDEDVRDLERGTVEPANPRNIDANRAWGRESITWLHISDLHFAEGDTYDSDIVVDGVVELVREERAQSKRSPGFIVVTGDLAQSGSAGEYEKATRFFDRLLEAAELAGQRERLVVVPGNHDVNRPTLRGLVRTLEDERESQDYFGEDHPRPHFAGQAGFRAWHDDFFKDVGRKASTTSTCGPIVKLSVAGFSVAILPVNTALFSKGSDDHGHLWVGRRALKEPANALGQDPADLRIVAMHHTTDWLCSTEQSQIRGLLRGAADMIFAGHLHEADVFVEKTATHETLHVVAGAAYQGSRYPCRVFFGNFSGTTIRLRPYGYFDAPGRWLVDPSVFPDSVDHEGAFDGPARGRGPGSGNVGVHGEKLAGDRERPSGRNVVPSRGTGPSDGAQDNAPETGDRRKKPEGGHGSSNHSSKPETPKTWDVVGELARVLEAGPRALLNRLGEELPELGSEQTALCERIAARVAELSLLPEQVEMLRTAWLVAATIDALGSGTSATTRLLDCCYNVVSFVEDEEPEEARQALATIRSMLLKWFPRRGIDPAAVRRVRREGSELKLWCVDLAVRSDTFLVTDGLVAHVDGLPMDLETSDTEKSSEKFRPKGIRMAPFPSALGAGLNTDLENALEIADGLAAWPIMRKRAAADLRRRAARRHFDHVRKPGRSRAPCYLVVEGQVSDGVLDKLKRIYPSLCLVTPTFDPNDEDVEFIENFEDIFTDKAPNRS